MAVGYERVSATAIWNADLKPSFRGSENSVLESRPHGSGWDIGADEQRSNPDPVNINRNVQFKPGTTFKAKQ